MTRSPRNGENDWTARALLWLGAILAFRIAALAFNRTDLMFDEAQYWAWSRDLAFGYFSKPPLIGWLIAGVTGLCGNSEFCVRLPSPVLYTAASFFVFLAGRRLYDARTGFWAALVFSTLPGVSFSSGIISTDVPLLMFWSLSLWAFVELCATRKWHWAVLLGLAVGLGLNAKYAMVYFAGCAALFIWREPAARWLARDARTGLAAALALALLVPNLYWNAANGLVTIGHTAANANWGGSFLHPLRMLEFIGAQFGVFGPILFALLLWAAWRARKQSPAEPDRLLLCFSIPVLLLIALQAFLSRAHANWAATAYPAAAILVTAVMLRGDRWRLLRASFAIHAAVMLALAAGAVLAPSLPLREGRNPYDRVLGWRELASTVREEMLRVPYQAILTDDRWVTSELLYYLRDMDRPIRSWREGDTARDHFELTRPYTGSEETLLLVTLRPAAGSITGRFDDAESLGEIRYPASREISRSAWLWALSGYRGY